MKGHKKQKCTKNRTLDFSDGSVYVGAVYDGKPSGKGRLYVRPDDYYTGQFLNGQKHGYGRQIGPRGLVYIGEWQNGKYHGDGELKTLDFKYEGRFKNGNYHGHGKYSMGNDIQYEGNWSNNHKHGHGTLRNSHGTYVGQFYFNLRHGKGIQTEPDGSVYTGSWRSGYRNGQGVYSNSFESYTGNWSNNKRHGHGKWVSNFLGTYEGQWKRNVRHKKGTHVYIDGSVYNGGWSYGKRTGHGVMKYADGSMYKGFWCNDLWNGQGKLTIDDKMFVGEFTEGEREGIFVERIDGKVVSKGPWLCDLRHGSFDELGTKKLYLWGRAPDFKSVKDARKSICRLLKKKDSLAAEEILLFYPELIKWSIFYKHDITGMLVNLLKQPVVEKKLRKHAYELFKQKRYIFIQRLFSLCSETIRTNVSNGVEVLFDKMTNEFVANPWIVRGQGYSKETKNKLLAGLHLGEFGRCPPRDPFTRNALTESSGEYLSHTKKAKTVYKQFSKSMSVEKPIVELAFEYDLQDFEIQLKNARDAGDRNTIMRLMKERNDFIKRYRSDSLCSDDCPNR